MKSLESLTNQEYKYGFKTEIEADIIPKGLTEDTVRIISAKRASPNGCWISG
jgi:Fe-S cluster assembly protein SufB